MSHRPGVRSAFENLRPSIVREPARTSINAQQERQLLDLPVAPTPPAQAVPQPEPVPLQPEPVPTQAEAPPKAFDGPTLLNRKRREVLIPLTFRIPQSLKEKLNEVAKRHDLNQTDLINEGIELNLQRYL